MTDLSQFAAVLDDAARSLKELRLQAKIDAHRRAFDTLKAMLLEFGPCDVLTHLANAADEIAMEQPDVPDWIACNRAMERCAEACDLTFRRDE